MGRPTAGSVLDRFTIRSNRLGLNCQRRGGVRRAAHWASHGECKAYIGEQPFHSLAYLLQRDSRHDRRQDFRFCYSLFC